MPTYKVQAPDGSTLTLEGPDGATDEQIIQAAQAAFSQRKPEVTTAKGLAGAATRGLALPAAGAVAGAGAGALLGGVGAVPGALAGAGAATLAQVAGDPIVSTINNLFGTKYTLPTDAMEDFLTKIGVAEPKTEAERIVQATAAGAAGAGGIAATGKAVQMAASSPVAREVGRQLAAQPLAQMAGGAGAGLAGQSVQEMGGTPAAQIAASLAGGVAGAGAVSRLSTKRPKTSIPPTVQQAKQMGVPVLTSDVIKPESFMGKTAQQMGERIPVVGTGPVRVNQQAKRVEAVRNVLQEFGAETDGLSEKIVSDLAKKRGEELSKYTQAKTEVIDRLSGIGEVPLPKSTQAIDDQISLLVRRSTEGADEAIQSLQKIKEEIQGRDLFQLEAYRKDELSKIFKDDPSRPMSLAARDAGEKALRAIYDPIRQDMGDFIKANGDKRDFTKWMVSNKRLQTLAGETEMGALKAVLKSGQATPEVVNRMLFSKKPSEVRQLYSGLTNEGRANARSSILREAAKKAEYQIEDGTTMYSPEKFNSELKRLSDNVGIFFQGDDKLRVEGLSRVLDLTKRAGEANVKTMTGQEAVPFVTGGVLASLFGGAEGALAAAAGIGATARIYESAPVRNLLLSLSKTKKGSAEEAAIAKRLLSVIQTQTEQE